MVISALGGVRCGLDGVSICEELETLSREDVVASEDRLESERGSWSPPPSLVGVMPVEPGK